jgi:tetratricopeptide (TPR) repeat protein
MGWSYRVCDRVAYMCRTGVLRFLHLAIRLSILAVFLCPGTVVAGTCEEWAAKVVSVQGSVEAQRAGEVQWQPVRLYETYCPGDRIRVQEHSRAAIVLPNQAILRLDQKTTITFIGLEQGPISVLDLLSGAVHFFSRMPRGLKVMTPFVNAAVEGTEFFVKVEREQTFLSVFEGRVAATNEAGSLTLASGQSSVAQAGQAPALRLVVHPRDAVQWALYYPPIVDYRPADFPGETAWQAMVRQSIQFYRHGDLLMAFDSIAKAPEDIPDPRFFTYRAALLLTVGRVDEASVDIARALQLDPHHAHAFALQSVIAVVQNNKDEALNLARQAVKLDPASSTGQVALSYAQQAHFDLQGALASLQEAVKLSPENALAWARLAELWLSVGELKKALKAMRQAVTVQPNLARPQTVLGFVLLAQSKIREARNAFVKAIELDQAAPLPRLGLGLAKIRHSDLAAGTQEIEIAASLDPDNSLIRSYLGKAYYEQKRGLLAAKEFSTAKKLDPNDPTPWLYDAIYKQSINRPIEALRDIQKSIELNDNRIVYRSRLFLDEDLGGRGARLGSIFRDLGFEQLALVEGWKSVHTDPGNHSAHRLLADMYAVLPRHEIARDSELLQSQLLQPINIIPVQPRLAGNGLAFLDDTGPANVGFNEFSRLFAANGLHLQADGIVGSQHTFADNVILSGIQGKVSYSIGQFHFETDGFRENHDLKSDIYNAFVQLDISPSTSVQAELRRTEGQKGHRAEFFDPNFFFRDFRQDIKTDSVRLGFRQRFAPNSTLLGSYSFSDAEEDQDFGMGEKQFVQEKGHFIELRYLQNWHRVTATAGSGYFSANQEVDIPSLPLEIGVNTQHVNGYVYTSLNYPKNVTFILGISGDSFDSLVTDQDQINPKLGFIWNIFPRTTLRAAAFRVLKRSFTSSQTLEPTHIAGFNQFFNDAPGTDAWRYGIAVDQAFNIYGDKGRPDLYAGFELSKRRLDWPLVTGELQTRVFDHEEEFARVYFYWTPLDWLALSTEYRFERFVHDPEALSSPVALAKAETHRLPLEFRVFHPSGVFARTRATYINQRGRFEDATRTVVPGSDEFWTVDALLGYRFPKRLGLATLEIRNLFDNNFQFQDTDPENSAISRDRVILLRLTLAF